MPNVTFRPKLTIPAARFLCESWATCYNCVVVFYFHLSYQSSCKATIFVINILSVFFCDDDVTVVMVYSVWIKLLTVLIKFLSSCYLQRKCTISGSHVKMLARPWNQRLHSQYVYYQITWCTFVIGSRDVHSLSYHTMYIHHRQHGSADLL